MSEKTGVTNPVLIALTALPGAHFWRENSGKFRSLDGKRIVRAGTNGIGDIMGVYCGHAVAIETKTKTGKLSEAQEHFKAAFTRAGGIYIVARSVYEAVSALTEIKS